MVPIGSDIPKVIAEVLSWLSLIINGDFLNNKPPLYVTLLKKLLTFSASGIISIPADICNPRKVNFCYPNDMEESLNRIFSTAPSGYNACTILQGTELAHVPQLAKLAHQQ